jgi:protein-tyrosine phosphatase
MRCVIDDVLWIGNAAEAHDTASLIEDGFTAVVDLAVEERPAMLPRELVYLRFPIHDGIGNERNVLLAAIRTTSILISISGFKIAVCCSMGMSRSPSIVAAAIALTKNQTADESLSLLMSRTNCDVSPGLWSENSQVCNSLTDQR